MSAFADNQIIKLAQTEFIPCSMDDWYQRRRQDAEGEFFRKVAAQGPRKEPNGTRQGIYILTADGELLAYKNAGQNVQATREQLALGLKKFRELPAERRKPGGVTIEAHGPLDATYSRTPPEGGLILTSYGRILTRVGDTFTKGTCEQLGGDRAFRDYVWFTADELKRFAPPSVGESAPFPDKWTSRLLRFHLVDASRGEPYFWTREQIRRSSITLTTLAQSPKGVEIRLEGHAEMSHAERGYDVQLRGSLRWLPTKGTFDRFEIIALGDYWGDSSVTRGGSREGKQPVGFVFELADPTVSANRVSPQGAREIGAYFGRY